jgi:hypothetical protein
MGQELAEFFPMSRKCLRITAQFFNDPLAMNFQRPFRSTPEVVEEYRTAVSTPMDFSTIRSRIMNYHYANYKEWSADMLLVFDNAIAFYGRQSIVGGVATYLKTKFLKRFELLKLSNARSFEDQVASAGARLLAAIQRIPDRYGIECCSEFSIPENRPFTVERFQRIASGLSDLCDRGFTEQIAQRLSATNLNAACDLDAGVEVATLPKRTLLELEELITELGGDSADQAIESLSKS